MHGFGFGLLVFFRGRLELVRRSAHGLLLVALIVVGCPVWAVYMILDGESC